MEPGLAILNYQKALASCKGDSALALRLIQKFHAALPIEKHAFTAAEATRNWDALDRLLHRLQSGSSNLGLERIDAAAQAVRIALRDGEPASDLCSQLALVCDEFFMQFGCENMTIQGCKQALEA